MFKVFTSRDYLPTPESGHVQFLFPVWGEKVEAIYEGHDIFKKFRETFPTHFEIVNTVKEADFAVLPADIKQYRRQARWDLAVRFLNVCQAAGVKLLAFFKDDSDQDCSELNTSSAIVYRTSFYASSRAANESAMPVWSGDLVEIYRKGEPPYRAVQSIPSVGFCGQTIHERDWFLRTVRKMQFKRVLSKTIRGENSERDFGRKWFPYLRAYVLDKLSASSSLNCTFITRSRYLGGAWLGKGKFDLESYRKSRREFVDNLFSSDAVPCVRGGGNYSLRLYEALCCGRIPIHVNVDSVLPFEDAIPWREHVIEVGLKDLGAIDQIVSERLLRCSQPELVSWQEKNRAMWREYLSPEGFFVNAARRAI